MLYHSYVKNTWWDEMFTELLSNEYLKIVSLHWNETLLKIIIKFAATYTEKYNFFQI